MTTTADILKKLHKDHGVHMATRGMAAYIDVPRIPTGIFSVDLAMGGGFPQGKCSIVFGPESSNKCHAKGTKVLMFDGSLKNVEDIVAGDQTMGVDSTPRNVMQSGKGHGMLYKITPSKGGDSFVVNGDHILSLMCTHTQGHSTRGDIVNISLYDYMKKSDDWKIYHHLYRVGVEFPEVKLPLDPYYVGLWLGDGSSDRPIITTMDEPIVDWMQAYADRKGWELRTYTAINRCPMYGLVGGRQGNAKESYSVPADHLKALGLLNNKHIPKDYKINSRSNRLALLAGLLDSDGNKGSGPSMGFVNTNKTLCDDVVFLARSLGFYASLKEVNSTYNGLPYLHYVVYLSGDFSQVPLLLERKVPSERKRAGSPLTSRFTIEELHEDDFYGFKLDGDHLYLLDSFIVNHNTNIVLKSIAEAQRLWPDRVCVFVDAEDALDLQWAATLGVDIDRLIVIHPEFAEQAVDTIESFCYATDVSMVVLDSIAALATQREIENSSETASVGGASLLVGKLYRKVTVSYNKMRNQGLMPPAFIAINQIRSKVGVMYGNPETMPGGNPPKFAASMILRVYGKNIFDKKINATMPVFKEVNCVIQKWKVPILSINAIYNMQMIHHGGKAPGYISDWNTISAYMKELDYLGKADKGGWLMNGETFKTLKDCEEHLYSDPELLADMKSTIIKELIEKGGMDEATGELPTESEEE